MQNIKPGHKQYLHSAKIIIWCVVVWLIAAPVCAQKMRYTKRNNPNYDQKRMSYGFLIGIHTGAYQVKYSDKFVTQDLDTVQAVMPDWSTGFSLGFIVNYRAAEFLDFRLTPKVSFYENRLKYTYTTEAPQEALIETTMVELSILAKYKSARRGNMRMYMIGGVTPAFEASGKKDVVNTTKTLEINPYNISLEGGFGFDFYYPLFKFSPEIRFSRGMLDILKGRDNPFGEPLSRVTTNTITIYFLFQ